MIEPIFVIARTTGGQTFESYADYWLMVKMWGYRTCELSEIDYQNPEHVYIWASPIGDPSQVFRHDRASVRKCKLVNWFLEWPKWVEGKLVGWEGVEDPVDEVWVSDMHLYDLARRFKPESAYKFRFLVLGGHPDFGNPNYKDREILWDFCHISYLTGMRGTKFYAMEAMGFKMAPNCWGAERDHTLKYSRWGLNLHQNPLPCLSPQRFMIFASYGLPIITDYCVNPEPFKVFQDAMIHFDPRNTSVSNEGLRWEAVAANYLMITGLRNFKAEVDWMVATRPLPNEIEGMQREILE